MMKTIQSAIALCALLLVPAAALKAEEEPAAELKHYSIFDQEMISLQCDYNGLIRSKQQVDELIKRNKFERELVEFLQATNYPDQCLLIYSFVHMGSGQDRPAYKLKLQQDVLVCTLFDANNNPGRTMDLRSKACLIVIRVNNEVVKEIKVTQQIPNGRRIGGKAERSFFTDIGEDIELADAVRIIGSLPSYNDLDADKIKHLKSFECTAYNLSETDLKALSLLPNLERAIIKGSNWTEEEVKILNGCKKLRELHVGGNYYAWGLSGSWSNFNNDHLAVLDIPSLESLDLANSKVDGDGLGELSRFPKLREVGLARVSLEGDAVRHLSNLKQCTMLHGVNVPSAEFMRVLGDSLKLEKLEIGTDIHEQEETRELFAALGEMDSLTWLHVADSDKKVDDATIAPLAKLPRLKHLGVVGYHQITDAGLVHCIKGMKGLESLSMGRGIKIGDAWIKEAGKLPIKRLDLRQTLLTDQGLEWIATSYPQVEELNLRHTKLTEKSVAHLKQLKRLKHLNVLSYNDHNIEGQLMEEFTFYKGDNPYHDSFQAKYH